MKVNIHGVITPATTNATMEFGNNTNPADIPTDTHNGINIHTPTAMYNTGIEIIAHVCINVININVQIDTFVSNALMVAISHVIPNNLTLVLKYRYNMELHLIFMVDPLVQCLVDFIQYLTEKVLPVPLLWVLCGWIILT